LHDEAVTGVTKRPTAPAPDILGRIARPDELPGRAGPWMASRHAHGVDVGQRNPALFFPVTAGENFAPRFRLPPGHVCPTLRSVRGSEFVRRIQALGKRRGVEVRWVAHRGKGSHGLLYYGSKMTTVRDLKDEVDKRAYYRMLQQLGLSQGDIA
jgi:mRNA interferase HicA